MVQTKLRKDLLRPDEIADYFRLSRKTIYAWVSQGKIESVKINGTIRIPLVGVEKLLAEKIPS